MELHMFLLTAHKSHTTYTTNNTYLSYKEEISHGMVFNAVQATSHCFEYSIGDSIAQTVWLRATNVKFSIVDYYANKIILITFSISWLTI